MCGVFGFVGESHDVGKTIGIALKRLEYRGYDSWGMAWQEDLKIRTVKEIGRVNGSLPRQSYSRLGIGHTRWATHGGVTSDNAHPHLDCTGRIAVVHNGIIENITDLRASLDHRHRIVSETDSEVIAHLIEERMVSKGEGLDDAMRAVFPRLDGFNAVVAIDARTGTMVATKCTSPLLIGHTDGTSFIASDAVALAGLVTGAAVIEDGTLVCINHAGIQVRDLATGIELGLRFESLAPSITCHDDHGEEPGSYMRREIDEQPAVVARIADDPAPLAGLATLARRAASFIIVGCGSALNAAEYGRYLLADHGLSPVVIPASEVRHFTQLIMPTSLVLAVSQSGETADVIDAVHLARARGAATAALVNVAHSTLARTVDHVVPLLADTEQSVLATKSFTAMLARFVQLAAVMSGNSDSACIALRGAAMAMHQVMTSGIQDEFVRVGRELARHEHVFVLGRGRTWPIARETALKIQEGAYIHAQAFPGGELKHGPLALITGGTPCLLFPGEGLSAKQLRSNAQEVRSRGGEMYGIGAEQDEAIGHWLATGIGGTAAGLVETAIAQLLAYRASLARGTNPDRPRNLAKSVTVK